MARIRACHVINEADLGKAIAIARSIQHQGLLVQQSYQGIGAWAYYVDMVLSTRQREPMIIFDVDDQYVTKWPCPLPHKKDYAYLQMRGLLFSYIPITVLGFRNLPGLPHYHGPVTFI